MKRVTSIILVILLTLSVVLLAVACKGKTVTVTADTDLSRVRQAFDGVEKSMKGTSSSLASQGGRKGVVAQAETSEKEALDAIFGVYEEGDKQTSVSGPEYDQPPMRQFQYLKAIFEEMGDDYLLGTKYNYDITGQMYFDAESGFRVDEKRADAANYLYNYVFGFAMSIEYKENGRIFAEVGFNISLSKGSENYKTSWYVSFDLDYDFNEKEPTYTLLMYTDNKEGELAFLHRTQGYEYDYVEVSKGAIKEWRKFDMDAEKEITFGGKYVSFSDYVKEGIEYNVGTCKWLKEGVYRKITRMTDAKQSVLASAFVDGLGLNSTNIKSAAFMEKSGTLNKVIDTYYKSICALYGDDIIYDLVCLDEDDEGGNDNGVSAHLWNSTVARYLSELVPGFESATATFSVETSDQGVAISVRNANAEDYARFEDALERVGFARTETGADTFVKMMSDSSLLIRVDKAANVIFAAVADASGNGGTGDRDPIEMLYACSYTYSNYTTYDKKQFMKAADLYEVIKSISFGTVTPSELEGLSPLDSFLYDITLEYSSDAGKTAAEYASEWASAYSCAYNKEGSEYKWTSRYDNMLHYASINGKEVLVLIASGATEGKPHLYVYVLQFEEGNLPRILESDGGENGGDIIGGENGTENGTENGNGSGNETGKDENGTQSGKDDNGNGSGNGGNEGPIPKKDVDVYVLYLNADKSFSHEESIIFSEGDMIEVGRIPTEEGQFIYWDEACTERVEKDFRAEDGLHLFVWAEAEEVTKQGTFTIYDVREKETTLFKQFDCNLGETPYYGYSFEQILYWDKGCTKQVPLDHTFVMDEEGITVYRHVYEDYFVLEIRTYINDHPSEDITSRIFRKEKIYEAFAPFGYGAVDDYKTSFYDSKAEFYLGEGKGTPLTESSKIATTKDKVVVSVYAYSEAHHVYTLTTEGGGVITRDYIVTYGAFDEFNYAEGMGNPFDYKGKSAEYCTLNGNVITMHNVKSLKGPLKVMIVWNGKLLCEDSAYKDTYFTDDSPFTFSGDVGPSENYFKDVACTDPILLVDNGYGTGEYTVSTATTLYTPYRI